MEVVKCKRGYLFSLPSVVFFGRLSLQKYRVLPNIFGVAWYWISWSINSKNWFKPFDCSSVGLLLCWRMNLHLILKFFVWSNKFSSQVVLYVALHSLWLKSIPPPWSCHCRHLQLGCSLYDEALCFLQHMLLCMKQKYICFGFIDHSTVLLLHCKKKKKKI